MDLDLGGRKSPLISEALAVARSREFIESFMTANGIQQQLLPTHWDAARKQWKPGEAPSPGELLQRFHEIAQFAEDKKRLLYFVQVDWHDATLAASWANALVVQLNATMRDRALERTAASLEQLKVELGATQQVDVRDRIAGLIELQVNERMIATVTPDYVFSIVDRAMPPDPRDRLRPRRGLMLMVGGIVGGFFGIAAILLLESLRRARAATARAALTIS